jgi:hypothetical protein
LGNGSPVRPPAFVGELRPRDAPGLSPPCSRHRVRPRMAEALARCTGARFCPVLLVDGLFAFFLSAPSRRVVRGTTRGRASAAAIPICRGSAIGIG